LNCREIIHFNALIEIKGHKHKTNTIKNYQFSKLSENKGSDHI